MESTKDCNKCKFKNTPVCGTCEDNSLWVKDNTFALVISAVMFGTAVGGIVAAVYFHFFN
jgi:hypothetical protein